MLTMRVCEVTVGGIVVKIRGTARSGMFAFPFHSEKLIDAFERLTSKQILGNGDCTRDLYYHSSPFLAGRGIAMVAPSLLIK